MKEQFLIFKAGQLAGKVIARDGPRACALFARKQGGSLMGLTAVAAVSTDAAREAARRRSERP